MKKRFRQSMVLVFSVLVISPFILLAQTDEIKPVTVEKPMPDFSLPVFQGGEMTLSEIEGKNILLIFPRGRSRENAWCHVCNYQYAEWAELEAKLQVREKYNVEILFVLPYGKELVTEWIDKFYDQLQDLEKGKNPPDQDKLDERGKRRMEFYKRVFPKSFPYEEGKVPLPFPILMDDGAVVSKGLGLFTTEWGGSKVEQNIPTVYIVDKNGILQFKYFSQNTFDRPGPDYLIRVLDVISSSQ
ncbi:MAG: redoxin domain-containing protein [Candidatus Aminicenantaceae bacterium]